MFILNLAKNNFRIDLNNVTEEERLMCVMLHYDVWQESNEERSLQESIAAIGENKILNEEIVEVLELIEDNIDFIEKDLKLNYPTPLKVHSRYTRDQIFAAFRFHTLKKKASIREGVAYSEKLNTELLFVTLDKSEKDFSPTTFYQDFAISATQFHWQSQNSAVPERGRGLSYLNHKTLDKKILLFVRERNEDEYGNKMAFVFLGEVDLKEYSGAKPMNIKWELQEPMPAYLWKDSAKMAIH